MKIKRFQVTIQPCRYPSLEDDWRDLSIEVIADFEDAFGGMMREAERLIRRAAREAEAVVAPLSDIE